MDLTAWVDAQSHAAIVHLNRRIGQKGRSAKEGIRASVAKALEIIEENDIIKSRQASRAETHEQALATREAIMALGCNNMREVGEVVAHVLHDLKKDGLLPRPIDAYSSRHPPYG